MRRLGVPRSLFGLAAGALLGGCWLLGDGLLGPGISCVLMSILAGQRSRLGRCLTALGYYATGSVPLIAAIEGYWGADHAALGLAAWLGSSLLLAVPWAFAATGWGTCAALALTALPPLGVIGWLSPLNAAGVLFPALGWAGVMLLCLGAAALSWQAPAPRWWVLLVIGLISAASNLRYRSPAPPAGWTGVHTRLTPARGNVFKAIHNNQEAIEAGLAQGEGAQVVVFAEALLDDWRPGTRQQWALAAPPGQLWIVGADTDSSDAVVRVRQGLAEAAPLTRAAGLILGGNWLPWSRQTLRPAWWQRALRIDGRRVWAALCVEQLQPWTWFEAMLQRPEVVLAMSNGWWAADTSRRRWSAGSTGLAIERASSRAWTRLMRVPLVWAANDPPSRH